MKQPLVEGEDYYWHNNLVVFTKKYHLARGYCCGMGCQHCPFDYEAVPEPKRSDLLEKREHEKNKNNE